MSAYASKADELQRRLVLFAAKVVEISGKLPRTDQGRHVCSQILRSGTSTAANYAEARGAESRSDFIHKLKIVLKELNETKVWLQLISQCSLLDPKFTATIVAENQELCRIIAASITTARMSGQASI
jgi:four helix bundle protein